MFLIFKRNVIAPITVKPANVVAPSFTGSPIVGQTLTGNAGVVSGTPTPDVSVQWVRGTTVLSTSLSYVVSHSDTGSTLIFRRIAINSAGTLQTDTAPTGVVTAPPAGAPTVTTPPAIVGVARVDNPLWVTRGVYAWTFHNEMPRFAFAYQWKRNGVNISGATQEIYVPVDADIGATLTIAETITDFYGSVTGESAPTAAIAADDRTAITAEAAGFKSTLTTGSIPAASNQLTVASVVGFAVNDPIIVEAGTETGAGAAGTDGVGGTWPSLAYANATAMNADASQISGKLAWLRDTGRVWRHAGGGAWEAYMTTEPYRRISYPAALKATITAIDTVNKILTLSVNSVAAATNANVYFDNYPRLTVAGNGFVSSVIRDKKKLVFLGGGAKYAFSRPGFMEKQTDLFMKGAGVDQTYIYAPNGCPPTSFRFRGSPTRIYIKGFTFRGTNTDTTTIPDFVPGGTEDPTNIRVASIIPEVSFYFLVEDCKFVNCWQAYSVSYGSDCWIRNCQGTHGGQLIYIQWHFQWSDTTRGGSYDVTQTNVRLMASHETFRSSGVRFHRFTGYNAHTSCNTSGGWDWIDTTITNDPQGAAPPYQILDGTPMQDCNSNIGNSSGGLGDALLVQGGGFWRHKLYQKSLYGGVTTHPKAFILGPGNVNVHVIDPIHIAPDYQAGVTSSPVTVIADASDNSQSVVRGIANYTPNPSTSNARADCFCFTSPTGGRVINSVADRIRAAQVSGNRTRAQFVAQGGTLPTAP